MSYSQERNKRIREIFESLPRKDQQILEGMIATFNVKGFGIIGFLDLVISLWKDSRVRATLIRGEFGRDTLKKDTVKGERK